MRAALGRVFGTVQVRRWEPDAPGVGAGTRVSDATAWDAPQPGMQERDWRLMTDTHLAKPPSAGLGGGGLDAATVPCTASDNAVPQLSARGVGGGPAGVPPPDVASADLEPGAGQPVIVLPVEVGLAGREALEVPVALPLPRVLPADVVLPGGRCVQAARHGRMGVPGFGVPRTASSLARAVWVPLVRRRAVLPADADIAESLGAARHALAAACGASVEEVKLIASFPHVPLALVQQMAVSADGEALRLWLRPEALASGAGWTAARVTVVVGRRRATGEPIRAVLPEAGPAGRKR